MTGETGVVAPLACLAIGAFVVYLVARLAKADNEVLASLTALCFAVALGFALRLGTAMRVRPETYVISSDALPTWGWMGSGGAFLRADPGGLIITSIALGLGILVAIYVMYLILGCFFDSISMMVLTLPFIAPVISNLGFSLLWFGVTYVLLAEVGLVTPPFGLNLFVLRGVVPKYGILTVARGALPFLIPTLFMVILLTVFPELALWLPSVLY